MGFTVRTPEYRYTEWVDFDYKSATPLWNTSHGVELYEYVHVVNAAARTCLHEARSDSHASIVMIAVVMVLTMMAMTLYACVHLKPSRRPNGSRHR